MNAEQRGKPLKAGLEHRRQGEVDERATADRGVTQLGRAKRNLAAPPSAKANAARAERHVRPSRPA